MKNPRELFKDKEYLLDEPEVATLLEYYEQLRDEIIEYKFEKNNNKELALLDMIKEVVKGCNAIQKEHDEHVRFDYPAPDYQETIANLKNYILERCKDDRIRW